MNIRDYSWNYYGISKDERKKLRALCENRKYIYLVKLAANLTDPLIADWLTESVTQHKSYDLIEYNRFLGQIPCGRTDFYAYRRKFYHNFKKLVQKEGVNI